MQGRAEQRLVDNKGRGYPTATQKGDEMELINELTDLVNENPAQEVLDSLVAVLTLKALHDQKTKRGYYAAGIVGTDFWGEI